MVPLWLQWYAPATARGMILTAVFCTCWNLCRTPHPHSLLQGKTIVKHYNGVSVRSPTHGHQSTVRALMKFWWLGEGAQDPSVDGMVPVTFTTSKRNHHQNKKTTQSMGENICKQCDQQGINFQNIQTVYTTQYQKTKTKGRRLRQKI